jgi:hypothetical protein
VAQPDTSFLRAGGASRLLALPLVSELSPALGSTASQLAGVATSAGLLGSGFTAVGLAATGVAGILLGNLISSLRAATEAKEAFNKAVRTGDVAKMADDVSKLGRLDSLRSQASAGVCRPGIQRSPNAGTEGRHPPLSADGCGPPIAWRREFETKLLGRPENAGASAPLDTDRSHRSAVPASARPTPASRATRASNRLRARRARFICQSTLCRAPRSTLERSRPEASSAAADRR